MGPTHWLPTPLQLFLGNPGHQEGERAWRVGGLVLHGATSTVIQFQGAQTNPPINYTLFNKHEEGHELKVSAQKRSTEIAQLRGFDQGTCMGLRVLPGERGLEGLPSS